MKNICMIITISVLVSLLFVSAFSSAYIPIIDNGIWKIVNNDTIIENNTLLNVNIGQNASTVYKLKVNGETFLTKNLTIGGLVNSSYTYLSFGSPFTSLSFTGIVRYAQTLRLYSSHNIVATFSLNFNNFNVSTGITKDKRLYFGIINKYIVTNDDNITFKNEVLNGDIIINTSRNLSFEATTVNINADNINISGDLFVTGNIYVNGHKLSSFYKGQITMTSLPSLPSKDWVVCNATNHVTYSYVPDLSGRFIRSVNSSYTLNSTKGNNTIALSLSNLPSTDVTSLTITTTTVNSGGIPTAIRTITQNYAGTGTSINIQPVYYALYYICYVGD